MIISKKHLSRRTFLRGAFGTTVALPFLDAMAPALSAQSNRAKPSFRFGAVYMPNAFIRSCGIRKKPGATLRFSPS